MAARANYLALDRPDISYATKELCRCFATPSVEAFDALKHLGRYLIQCPRLVWRFFHQANSNSLKTMVDTDFAGCLSTRRSTSGGVALRGAHLIKHWSLTQSYVTLSSAESELNGICRGASTSLGLRTIAQDLGLTWDVTLLTDASAAIGVCRRRGLGKIRHLAVADLWVQDRLRTGDVQLQKIAGCDNPSDSLTKHVERPLLLKHIATLGLVAEEGRARLAPKIQS